MSLADFLRTWRAAEPPTYARHRTPVLDQRLEHVVDRMQCELECVTARGTHERQHLRVLTDACSGELVIPT